MLEPVFLFSCGGESATLGNEVYEEFTSVSGHVCNELFSISEDGFGTRRMTMFCKLFGRYQDPERKLLQLRDHPCVMDAKF